MTENDLEHLAKKIEEARHGPTQESKNASKIKKSVGDKAGMEAGMEFVVAIAFSSFVGFKLDAWLGTSPLWLIVLFILGTGAGFTSIFRASKNIGSSVGYSQLHKDKKDAKKPENKSK